MTDDTPSLVAWLAEAKRDGRITTYAIELRDADQQVVVTVVPAAYEPFVETELHAVVEHDAEQPTRVFADYDVEEIDAGVELVTPRKPDQS